MDCRNPEYMDIACILDPGTNPPGADLDARSAGRSPNRRDAVAIPAGVTNHFDLT